VDSLSSFDAGAFGGSRDSGLETTGARPGERLPHRGEFVIRDAYVLTMEPEIGDIPKGSVHIKDGEIVAVGTSIDAPSASVIDGRRAIVLPGLIDTHWHMWTTFLRCMAGDTPDEGYFPVTTRYGEAMEPMDMYNSTRMAAAEAISYGITTVGDNCHNIRSHDYAVHDIRAIQESGLRCRWSYGPYRGMPANEGIDFSDLERFHREWASYSNEGLISLGFMWSGPITRFGAPPPALVTRERTEFERARQLGIPMCLHWASRENGPQNQVELLARENFLGEDVLLIHMLATSPVEMNMVAAAGSPISVSPGAELRIGYGLTKACDFLDAGIVVAVSVDAVPLTGNANLFEALKLLRNTENARAHNEFKLTARRALKMVTIDAARALNLQDQIGSLKPGKRADLIMVRTDHINMGVFTDPTHMLVEATEQSNVDTVIVDGRILKHEGQLTALSVDEVIAGAAASLQNVTRRLQ
jgi:5-methylthioadenosine/S-adenosylhomocysteine deaminase